MYISKISPLYSSLEKKRVSPKMRVWEPSSKKGGQTLFYHHPLLMKWDWDIPDPAHSEEAVTIAAREEVVGILSTDPWARTHAWGLVDSWGGINAYMLSGIVPLHHLSEKQVMELKNSMTRNRVDPFYIKNVDAGFRGKWSWCSRVWLKTWRPEENWTGKYRCVLNPSETALNPKAVSEFKKILDLYSIFN